MHYSPGTAYDTAEAGGPAYAPARAFFLDRLQSEELNLSYCVRELSETQTRIDHLRTALAHLPS